MKIRPRIFLEGNFFVDVAAGLGVGARSSATATAIPINQTGRAGPARPGAVGASRRRRARDLQGILEELSTGLERRRRARRCNRSIPYWAPAYRDTSIVADALQGTEDHDLSRFIANEGDDRRRARPPRRPQLKSLIVDFDTTAATLAAHDRQLSRRGRRAAAHAARRRAGAAHAERRVPARAAPDPRRAPGRAARRTDARRGRPVRPAGPRPRLRARAARPVARPATRRAAAHDAREAHRAALRAGPRGVELPERGRPAVEQGHDRGQGVPAPRARSTRRRRSRCPASPARAARATRTASGSGSWSPRRSSPTRSAPTASSSPATRSRASTRRCRRTTSARRCGPTCRARPSSRPTCARSRRPARMGSRCRAPSLDQLAEAAAGHRRLPAHRDQAAGPRPQGLRRPGQAPGADEVRRAIRKHLRDFAAIVALAAIAAGVGGYVLANQRLRFPWEGAPFRIKAEFATAQAVTPGQGQTVRVSGVRVGDITKVDLKDGRAVVTMDLDPSTRASSTPTRARCCGRRPG